MDKPGEVVDRLRQMADMLAGALAQGEQKVNEAKQDATRARRIAQAVEWLAEGKRRNWKYENC